MKKITKKAILMSVMAILIAAVGILVYQYDQPWVLEPDPNWEPTIASLDVTRERFFIQSGNVRLESELLIPSGGRDLKPVVIFSGGSGHHIYQHYSPGLLEKYVLGVFLPRDMAVLFMNKRGLGESEGNFWHSDFQDRSDDVYAAVQYLQGHSSIDAGNIGLVGHSQGAWIVTLAASQHEDIAFFISLAGPTRSVYEHVTDEIKFRLRCEGYQGGELQELVEKELSIKRLGATIGKFIPLGDVGQFSKILYYDPRPALQTAHSPGLLVFGEMDPMAPADQNLARFNEIFNGNPPDNLKSAVLAGADHGYFTTDSMCTTYEEGFSGPLSDELVDVMQTWLTEQGY